MNFRQQIAPVLFLGFFAVLSVQALTDLYAPSAQLVSSVAPIKAGHWYRPSIKTTWQWQLHGPINMKYNVEVYDIDLFETPVETIKLLKTSGKRVICYFSAGSSEKWRPDFSSFDKRVIGKPLKEWPGENWLDIRSQNVLDITNKRLDLAVSKSCDGVEPDNVDGYLNKSGFSLMRQINLLSTEESRTKPINAI